VVTEILKEHSASVFEDEVYRFRIDLVMSAGCKEGDHGTQGEGVKKGL
jgi:hypothetical protein